MTDPYIARGLPNLGTGIMDTYSASKRNAMLDGLEREQITNERQDRQASQNAALEEARYRTIVALDEGAKADPRFWEQGIRRMHRDGLIGDDEVEAALNGREPLAAFARSKLQGPQQPGKFGTSLHFDKEGNAYQVSSQGGAVRLPQQFVRPAISVNAGDAQTFVDPITGQQRGTPIAKGLPPQNTPQHAADVASATAQGRIEGEEEGGAEKRVVALGEITDLLDTIAPTELNALYGTLRGLTPSLRQESVDAEGKIVQVIALLSLEGRAKLTGSGSISDFESKQLAKSATILENWRISPTAARREVERVKNILGAAKRRAEKKAGQAAPATQSSSKEVIIENDAGVRLAWRNGQWVPL